MTLSILIFYPVTIVVALAVYYWRKKHVKR